MQQYLNHCFIPPLGFHFLVADGPLQTPYSWWAVPTKPRIAMPANHHHVLVNWLAEAALLRQGHDTSKLTWGQFFPLWEAACLRRAGATVVSLPLRSLFLCITRQKSCFLAKEQIGILHHVRQQPIGHAVTITCIFFFLLDLTLC